MLWHGLVKTLSRMFLREGICDWIGNARSALKTCKRALVLLLLLGVEGCSGGIIMWQIFSIAWSGDGVKFRDVGSLCLYSEQLMTVTEQFLLSVLHHFRSMGYQSCQRCCAEASFRWLQWLVSCFSTSPRDRSLRCILIDSPPRRLLGFKSCWEGGGEENLHELTLFPWWALLPFYLITPAVFQITL